AKRRSRLEVESKTFYYSNSEVAVSAQYFDKNYVFDPRAQLNITVTNTGTDQRTVFPMLLKNNFFQVGLNTLPAGEYKFTVAVKNETVARSGGFSILDYNVEQQFLHANVAKLRTLAKNTAGRAYFAHESVALATRLLTDNRFSTIQKNEQKTVPLIDWKYLLALLVLSLSAEWFIRKYNGLI
ncbi:MAG: VWA domain-containing protein, partial [Marinirhabdus sp.]